MPNLTPIVSFTGYEPYQYNFDNLPISSIAQNISIINNATDLNTVQINLAAGTAGNLNIRLNQSLDSNGNILTTAVNTAMHDIGSHIDDDTYVRYTVAERSKLSLIESDATNLTINIGTISSTSVSYPTANNTINFTSSSSIGWLYDGLNISPALNFSLDLITVPWVDISPILISAGINYQTTSMATSYVAGTLRVYINGIRLTKSTTINSYTYTEVSPADGTFALNTPLTAGNVLTIDFNQPI